LPGIGHPNIQDTYFVVAHWSNYIIVGGGVGDGPYVGRNSLLVAQDSPAGLYPKPFAAIALFTCSLFNMTFFPFNLKLFLHSGYIGIARAALFSFKLIPAGFSLVFKFLIHGGRFAFPFLELGLILMPMLYLTWSIALRQKSKGSESLATTPVLEFWKEGI